MKHTPGPWEIEQFNEDYVKKEGRLSIKKIAIFCLGYQVATVIGEDWETRKANARLIASAPELLEACKYVLEMCNGHHDDIDIFKDGIKGCVERAIAKAEGKED